MLVGGVYMRLKHLPNVGPGSYDISASGVQYAKRRHYNKNKAAADMEGK